ncbi:ATP-binding protein [Candidatus Saccharibacteria bacterium]|mgnify:CR=1 FL=1|jgi:conjugal transfer ATP-binding protein TraC|nr:ATP-binding protein [Candidatus Saccharibacteria bacterium]
MAFNSKQKNSQDTISITEQQRLREQQEVETAFLKGITELRDFVAPSSLEFSSSEFKLGTFYARTLYVFGYPRQIFTGWLSPIINLDEELDVSMFIYPVASQIVLENLRKKVTQLEAGLMIDAEKGRTRDPGKQAAIADAEELRDRLQVGEERFFRFGLYLTIYSKSLEELDFVQHKLETILGQQLVYSKIASSQMESGFNSTLPQNTDDLQIRRNMNTGALSTSFPFTSSDLTQENGILYGINMHNNGLVIFDRFRLENANMVVFAKSGAGKSFAVKLEALRSMMMGTEVVILDPENEYQKLAEAVGGAYIRLSLSSTTRINPFDLPRVIDVEEADNALRANLIMLHGLFRLMMQGQMNPVMEADLDQALIDTYSRAGITADPLTHQSRPPVIGDLYETLAHMQGTGPAMAQMIRKYITGTFAGIFSQQSNIDIDNNLVVFNIRDLEEELRPVGMYIVLNHIWNKTKSDRVRRNLIIDEAWQLLKYKDSSDFMFSLAKRARKYYLGLTTITQDVEDMMTDKAGRAIVSNSSMQLLMKQSTSAVDILQQVFKLTSEEKKRLTQFPVGQGLLFAGSNHVQIQIRASDTETEIITTDPAQLLKANEVTSIADASYNLQAQNPEQRYEAVNSNVTTTPSPPVAN